MRSHAAPCTFACNTSSRPANDQYASAFSPPNVSRRRPAKCVSPASGGSSGGGGGAGFAGAGGGGSAGGGALAQPTVASKAAKSANARMRKLGLDPLAELFRAIARALDDALRVLVGKLEVLGEIFQKLRFGGGLLAVGVREERCVREQDFTARRIERLGDDVALYRALLL